MLCYLHKYVFFSYYYHYICVFHFIKYLIQEEMGNSQSVGNFFSNMRFEQSYGNSLVPNLLKDVPNVLLSSKVPNLVR